MPRPSDAFATRAASRKWVVASTIAAARGAGSSDLKIPEPTNTASAPRAAAIVEATTHFADPERVARASEGLGSPMQSLEARKLEPEQTLASRGW